MHVQQMIKAHPTVRGAVDAAIVRCIETCYDCAQTCVACADACLAEDTVRELRLTIRLNLDCADLCVAAGAAATRQTASNQAIVRGALQLCADACRTCAEECRRHAAHMEHCRICAEVCDDCAQACEVAIPAVR